jgi:hypothetical protein
VAGCLSAGHFLQRHASRCRRMCGESQESDVAAVVATDMNKGYDTKTVDDIDPMCQGRHKVKKQTRRQRGTRAGWSACVDGCRGRRGGGGGAGASLQDR